MIPARVWPRRSRASFWQRRIHLLRAARCDDLFARARESTYKTARCARVNAQAQQHAHPAWHGKAASSDAVKKEIIEFKKTKRTIIPVSFDGALEKAEW